MKSKTVRAQPSKPETVALADAVVADEPARAVNLRAAKDQLSSLVEAAARGDEVVITSHGHPKAKLVAARARRKPFQMHWSWLRAQPMSRGARAESVVREDRDARFWSSCS